MLGSQLLRGEEYKEKDKFYILKLAKFYTLACGSFIGDALSNLISW